MASVRWSLRASQDLRDILEYVGQRSPGSADALLARISSRVRRLQEYPRLGRQVPEFSDESVREVIVGRYRVIYTHADAEVSILAVIHGSRNLLRGF